MHSLFCMWYMRVRYGTCVEVLLSCHCVGSREIKLRPSGVGASVFAH